jgi:hypothetical protein
MINIMDDSFLEVDFTEYKCLLFKNKSHDEKMYLNIVTESIVDRIFLSDSKLKKPDDYDLIYTNIMYMIIYFSCDVSLVKNIDTIDDFYKYVRIINKKLVVFI